jgi:hypothetical protein
MFSRTVAARASTRPSQPAGRRYSPQKRTDAAALATRQSALETGKTIIAGAVDSASIRKTSCPAFTAPSTSPKPAQASGEARRRDRVVPPGKTLAGAGREPEVRRGDPGRRIAMSVERVAMANSVALKLIRSRGGPNC